MSAVAIAAIVEGIGAQPVDDVQDKPFPQSVPAGAYGALSCGRAKCIQDRFAIARETANLAGCIGNWEHCMFSRILWLVIASQVLAGSASADARDNVEAALRRCTIFADPHTWLDCYYGAAQPMRAQLGLTPAPKSQTDLVATAPPATPAPIASAAPAGGSAPQHATVSANRSLGWLDRLWGEGNPVSHWEDMVSYSFDAHGLLTAHLADGSTWSQTSDDANRAHLTEPAKFYRAIIVAGQSGGFAMKISGGTGLLAVKRQR